MLVFFSLSNCLFGLCVRVRMIDLRISYRWSQIDERRKTQLLSNSKYYARFRLTLFPVDLYSPNLNVNGRDHACFE